MRIVTVGALMLLLAAGVAEAQNPTAVLTAPAHVPAGQPFVLDGSRSTDPPPGRIVRYMWTNLGGGTPVVTVEPRWSVTEPLPPGRHRFQLVVTDDSGNQSQPVVVQVIVTDTTRPTAVLTAPAQVVAGRTFVLDGSRSTDALPGRVVRYTWTNLATNTPVVTVEPRLSVTEPLKPGPHRFQLSVTDDAGNQSEPVVAQVMVIAVDTTRPIAVLTVPRHVPAGQTLVLDGSRSTDAPPGRVVRYAWTNLAMGTPVVTAEPRLSLAEPLAPGRYQFQLVVTDDAGNESEPTVAQVIVADTTRPTAVLTAPAQVSAGQTFLLDGSRSSDPAPGRIVRYTWTAVARGAPIQTAESRLSVTEPLTPGRHRFQLVVTDDAGNDSRPATIEVIVAPAAGRKR